MRVCVTGGRDYANQSVVWRALDEVDSTYGVTLLGHGACHYGGADILAEDWAKQAQVLYMGIPAQWKLYGKPAGMRRNAQMLDIIKPELLLAFPGGVGTAGCIKEAVKRAIEVRTYE